MRRALVVLAAFLCSASGEAALSKIWIADTSRDFSAGSAHGIAPEANGSLALSRKSEKIQGFTASTVFSCVESPSGVLFFGTGGAGEVFRQEPGKPAVLETTLPEKEVTALALSPGGALLAATSPHGKVYRVEKGKFSVEFDPGAEYIWSLALAPGGLLYVATGIPGKIFRVSGPGKGELFFDSEDDHVRCLYTDPQGRLWAGTASRGLLLRFGPDGKASTIFDSQRPEISSITSGPEGGIWAAAVSGRPAPGGAPGRGAPVVNPRAAEKKGNEQSPPSEPNASVTVSTSVSFTREPPPPPTPRGGESSEILEVASDDSVTSFWQSEEEIVFSLSADASSGGLLVSTGPKGRLYQLRKGGVAIAESLDEKRVLFAGKDFLVTDSPASAYRRTAGRSGEFVSNIRDMGRPSKFGAFRSDLECPAGSSAAFSFRSGSSSLPDSTWSAWSAPAKAAGLEKIPAPKGRFLQWKVSFESPDPARSPHLSRVECAYQNQNTRPTVEAVAAGPGREPAGTSLAPASTDSGGAPDSIFAGPDERTPAGAAPRADLRGHLIVTWKATDPDGDELLTDLEFRPAGSPTWIAMRKELRGSSFGFDSSLLPDGRYVFRATVSDSGSNPDDPKSDSKLSDPVLIDNSPPRIDILKASREGDRFVVRLKVTDASSPIAVAAWSLEAGPWNRMVPDDGMTDSPSESYKISLKPEARGGYLLIRAADSAGNPASVSLAVP
jgi:hypothetical protein